jgi:hypothetical protein
MRLTTLSAYLSSSRSLVSSHSSSPPKSRGFNGQTCWNNMCVALSYGQEALLTTFLQVNTQTPVVKRPSHFVSLNEGLSRGRVKAIRPCSSPSSSPRPHTPDTSRTSESKDAEDDSDGLGIWSLREFPTPRASPGRYLSPLPPRTAIILPSKRQRLESDDGSG